MAFFYNSLAYSRNYFWHFKQAFNEQQLNILQVFIKKCKNMLTEIVQKSRVIKKCLQWHNRDKRVKSRVLNEQKWAAPPCGQMESCCKEPNTDFR